jgi:hypothetical protein
METLIAYCVKKGQGKSYKLTQVLSKRRGIAKPVPIINGCL